MASGGGGGGGFSRPPLLLNFYYVYIFKKLSILTSFFNLILTLLNPHLLLQIYGGNHGLKSRLKVFFVIYYFLFAVFFFTKCRD